MDQISPKRSLEYVVNSNEMEKQFDENDIPTDSYISDEVRDAKVEELAKEYEISEKVLSWKTDLYVLLPLFVLYLIATLNRSHTGLLWTMGLQKSLKMESDQMYHAVTAFYVPYVVCQCFSNFVLRFIRPHFYISVCTFTYGAFILGTGFVQTYGGYVACEVFHGLFQSGCDSAIFYILSNYYERRNTQKRVSFIYSAICLSMLINILVTRDIQDNLPDPLQAWRWLLKIEGPITMFLAVFLFFFVPDFPEGNRFLNDNETLFIVKKLEIYTGKSGYHIPVTLKDAIRAFKDPLVISSALATHCLGAVSIGITLFEPLGFAVDHYGRTRSKLPNYVWLAGFLGVNLLGWISDLTKRRLPVTLFSCAVMICGVGGLLFHTTEEVGLGYIMAILAIIGSYSAYAEFIGWSTFNFYGHLRRTVITSVVIAFCDASGMYAAYAKPKVYLYGFIFSILATVFILIYYLCLVFENKKKSTFQYAEKFATYSEKRQVLEGDKRPNFRYMY